MTHSIKTPAFRVITLAFAVTLAAAVVPASAMDRDPTAPVPDWISASSFNSMDANAIYEIDHAQKLGERVIIEGHTATESRDLVDEALSLNTVASQATTFEQRAAGHWPQRPESDVR